MIETIYRLPCPVGLALLADFHNSDPYPILRSLERQRPEVITIAGDLVFEDNPGIKEYALLRGCAGIAPTYVSLGNHEWLLTAEDLDEYFNLVLKPLIIAEIEDRLDAHDKDPAAHDGTPADLRCDIRPRVCMAELLEELAVVTGEDIGYAHEGIEAFRTLDDISVTNGNWNDRLYRVEF